MENTTTVYVGYSALELAEREASRALTGLAVKWQRRSEAERLARVELAKLARKWQSRSRLAHAVAVLEQRLGAVKSAGLSVEPFPLVRRKAKRNATLRGVSPVRRVRAFMSQAPAVVVALFS